MESPKIKTNDLVLDERVKVLDWLFDKDDFRQTGRSTAMALMFVKQAIKYPAIHVKVFDHIELVRDQNINSRHSVMDKVEAIVSEIGLSRNFSYNRATWTIRYES